VNQRKKADQQDSLLSRDRIEVKKKLGGGLISIEVWGYTDSGKTVVTRYNLAYINHSIFNRDNGRVLGFDNTHNFHHRRCMGSIEAFDFQDYEATLERFQKEWREIVALRKKKDR